MVTIHRGVLPIVSYGRFNPSQRKTVGDLVKGRVVFDLGAGDLLLAKELIQLGASKVVAIDKDAPFPWSGDRRIEVRRDYFHQVKDTAIDVAFVSWPSNYVDWDLIRLVGQAETVVYLGKNTDGTSCGSVALFEHLLMRKLLAHVPDRSNTLLAYGEFVGVERDRTGEELAALTTYSRMWSYSELYPG